MSKPLLSRGAIRSLLHLLLAAICVSVLLPETGVAGGTNQREIQERAAPVAKRKCLDGPNVGSLCNEDAMCNPSTCADRNVFNMSVAILFDATPAQIQTIEAMIADGNEWLFDATDGQAEIGEVFIFNNAYNNPADFRVLRDGCDDGTNYLNPCASDADCPVACDGGACDGGPSDKNACTSDADCSDATCGPVWWRAGTGGYKRGGSINVSMIHVNGLGDGDHVVHEFSHLVFDTKDEYQRVQPNCGDVIADDDHCPVPDTTEGVAGQTECIMSTGGAARDEYCWGLGDSSDPLDISGGNHDAHLSTEQSRCRDDRSCWEQVVWSWPDVMLLPSGAPDPDAHGAVTQTPKFVLMEDQVRAVLVLDESGSMDDLDGTPTTRLERLQIAAQDFVTLAEDGTELGIVSFSTDATNNPRPHSNVPIGVLGADRSAWNDAITNLDHDGATNIGDGLQKAKDMIDAMGPVTANTFIILMTDGINNRPTNTEVAREDLDAKLADLLAANIPVYVTCTGTDTGLSSQCAEIADGTNGWYVDSDEPWELAEAFVELHERGVRRDALDSERGLLSGVRERKMFVELGAESMTFSLLLENPEAEAELRLVDPNGTEYRGLPLTQGSYRRIRSPVSGDWKVLIEPTRKVDSRFVLRAHIRNQDIQLTTAARHPVVRQGDPMYLFGYLRTLGGDVTHPTGVIRGQVRRPDGSMDRIDLRDQGRDPMGRGDDQAGDGIFTGVYERTDLPGNYRFLLRAAVDGWPQSIDSEKVVKHFRSRRFMREARLSTSVGGPNKPIDEPQPSSSYRWTIITLVAIGLVIAGVAFVWRRARPGRAKG